ncbi:hypothetical protein GCM10009775_18090 [Microbacterium aoyamense]|uniref:Large extracellular alpha-helical protein n=1 Tax=Microbacterium aoyamense TaxID=344166 RepID=A0ABN2PMU5_9MICO|nr:DUF5719 family protein [Microbacterium aoyamense]
MSDRRIFRWATTSARLLVGAAVAVGVVFAVVTAVHVPWPTLVREPVAIAATPPPAATTLVCAGGVLVQGRDAADAARLEVAAPQSVTVGVPPGSPEPEATRLAAPDVAQGEGPAAYTLLPEAGSMMDAAAAGSATVTDDDLTGFAATACRPALTESWLVTGSASVGAADFVVLANPGTSTATVQLTVYGANGPVVPPGGADVVVAAGAQRVVPLSGLALGESSPVIRVNAEGAPVQAFVQSSLTRVLVPGGIDQAGAIASADEILTIAGVSIVAGADDTGTTGEAPTVVRVLSPTEAAQATLTVRRVGDDEPAIDPQTVPLEAGLPTEVGIGSLPVGQYIVDVIAEAPVVAGVWQATGFGEDSDFGWYLPSPALTVPSLVSVPSGPSATLTLVNADESPALVTVSDAGGEEIETLDLAPGASDSVRVRSGRSYVVDGGGAKVLAGVSMTATNALAGFPVWPADAAAPPITIYP